MILAGAHNIMIDSYEEYLEHIKNWDNLTQDEHEQLRKGKEIITRRIRRQRGNVIECIMLQILTWKKRG
jgi:hypothetical protein